MISGTVVILELMLHEAFVGSVLGWRFQLRHYEIYILMGRIM
jgi:hypothetical protein